MTYIRVVHGRKTNPRIPKIILGKAKLNLAGLSNHQTAPANLGPNNTRRINKIITKPYYSILI